LSRAPGEALSVGCPAEAEVRLEAASEVVLVGPANCLPDLAHRFIAVQKHLGRGLDSALGKVRDYVTPLQCATGSSGPVSGYRPERDDFVLVAMILDHRSARCNWNMVPQQALDEEWSGPSVAATIRMVRDDDDDPCPTVSTLVVAGNEQPGVDDHEPLLGALGADAERCGTGSGRLLG
jgi:hypothetical protein